MTVAAFSIAASVRDDASVSSTRRVQIFSGFTPEEMSRIAAQARSLRKARGEFIYMPGDRADFVYFLKQGRIKLSVLSESGKEIAIDIIQPGEIFGEFALVDESPRSNMAQALDDMLMWVFPKREMGSCPFVVTEIRTKDFSERGFVKHNYVIQAFPPYRSDQSLRISVLPR